MGIKEGVTHTTYDIVSDDTISHVDLIAVYEKNGIYVDNRKFTYGLYRSNEKINFIEGGSK